ncbi:MAG: outer membrane lipoprotein carrier protein LolA [Bacteroidales bacterium]|nr:outer membrane lipoprotein carrier protein LolA [Bacteroidales bacterium]
MKRRISNIVFLTVLALIMTSSLMEVRGQGKGKAKENQRDKDKSELIISQFSTKLMTLPAFEMGFSIIMDGKSLFGTIQAQKDSYRLENREMNLYCDGQTKWIHNQGNNEVVILKNDLTQVDLVENPMAFFTSLAKGYTYAERAKSSDYKNVPVWIIDLFPINKRLGYSKISLLIDKRNNEPVRIVYVMKNGESLAVNITKFTEQKPWGKDHFKFDSGKHKGLRISDMR